MAITTKPIPHPLQSPAWGKFRQKTGLKVIRKNNWQVFVHPIPKLPWTILYFPKGPKPTKAMLQTLKEIGKKEKAIFVKLEPNITRIHQQKNNQFEKTKDFLLKNKAKKGQTNFTPWTFQIDLTQSEDQLLKKMKSKTRYNIKVSQRHQVKVIQDNSKKAFNIYLKLLQETTQRQNFFAHTPKYHRLLWETLVPENMYHLFLGEYKKKILAAQVFLTYKDGLHYAYGASTRENRNVMAPYALFWEAMKFGKRKKCRAFDLWGTRSPNPKPSDPWFGFHRFKQGFGGKLIEFVGAYDLPINPYLYPIFNFTNTLRWQVLRLKNKVS